MRILFVEDDAAFAAAIKSYLLGKGFALDHVSTLAEARSTVPLAAWDAVLLDLHLPDGDGYSLIAPIRRHQKDASIIILTARDQVSDRIRGLDLGADDYLVKPFDPDELMARLRAIERRRSGGDSSLITIGELVIDLASMRIFRKDIPVILTAKEWGLLRILASRLDRLHTKEALLEALYGFNDEVGSNTLEVFIHNMRSKLGVTAIQTVRGMGYRLTGGAA